MKMYSKAVLIPGWLALLSASTALSAAAGPEPDVRREPVVVAVEKVMPSVVNIATKTVVPVQDPIEAWRRRIFRRELSDTFISVGSGVIIDEAGYLLTNDHVVRGSSQIGVQFNEGTNVFYEARLIASDRKRDVALLKLMARPGETFRAIALAREDDLLLGETVLALGNPYGLGGSVTRGILSSKNRILPKEGARLDVPNWLQTDAAINEGNSGGPLINLRGELIGINVAVVSEVGDKPAQGLGFAIPIRLVEEALSDILRTEFVKSNWFGARVKVGTSPVTVSIVHPESPAARAGLRTNDVILRVNGKAPKSFIDFAELLAGTTGPDVALTVQRGAEEKNLAARLVPETTMFNARMIRDKLGLNLEALSARETAERFPPLNLAGVYLITEVQKGGPAAAEGLRPGLLVAAIDGEWVADLGLSRTAVAKLLYPKAGGDAVELAVVVPRQRAANYFDFTGGTVRLKVR
jgi:serine protease Do